jgi:hypothetical protein
MTSGRPAGAHSWAAGVWLRAIDVIGALPPKVWIAIGATCAAASVAATLVMLVQIVRARRARRAAESRTTRAQSWRSRRGPAKTTKVLSLATRGESRAEIARKLGVSQDVVAMIMNGAGTTAPARKNLPDVATPAARRKVPA